MIVSRSFLVILALALANPTLAQENKGAGDQPQGVAVPPAPTGGPDAFGYVWFDGSQPECDFSFVDISATGTVVTSGDDASSGPIALPGPAFNFYGTNYTQLVMATNGYISTDPTDTGPDLSNDCPLPATPSSGGGARLYPLHDDLITGSGLFEHITPCPRASGAVAGEGCYVFQWNGVEHFGGTGVMFDMQALLYDTSFGIVYQIGPGNPEQGSGSTTGIQNEVPDDALTYACNSAASIPDNTAVCFFHPNFPFGGGQQQLPEPAEVPALNPLSLLIFALIMVTLGAVSLRFRRA